MEHQYETVVILTPVMTEDQVKDTVAKYRALLEKGGATIVDQQNWGLTKMAYQIQNKGTAYYTVLEYKAPTDLLPKFELQLKRDESVLRFLSIVLDKHSISYNQRRRNGELKSQQPKKAEA
jgi:small subunit ribosomal protein S6